MAGAWNKLVGLAPPDPKPVRLKVSVSAARALRAGDPWLFNEKIQEQSREGRAGDIAVAVDARRRFVAVGLYDPLSPLRMRVLQAREPVAIDRHFFEGRLKAAVARRASLAARATLAERPTNGYRLVHGESDGMPGFVADRYADVIVVKLYSHAWLPHLKLCLDVLMAQHPETRAVFLRFSRQLGERPEGLFGLQDGDALVGCAADAHCEFLENGLRFEIDAARGQKTGFFLDQRDNRARCESFARGLRVLNAFSYSGGFSLGCARGGARSVWSLDQSAPALASARANFERNRHWPGVAAAKHRCVEADAFEALAAWGRGEDGAPRFDMVILDPPAFAGRKAQLERASGAYAQLARLGLGVLVEGGRFVMASCSRVVAAEHFRELVTAAASAAGRPLRELELTGQPLDHPVDFAESRYLKCIFARA